MSDFLTVTSVCNVTQNGEAKCDKKFAKWLTEYVPKVISNNYNYHCERSEKVVVQDDSENGDSGKEVSSSVISTYTCTGAITREYLESLGIKK